MRKHKVDERHPYLVYDPNKCILCARCIRTCERVADYSGACDIRHAYTIEQILENGSGGSFETCGNGCVLWKVGRAFPTGPCYQELTGTMRVLNLLSGETATLPEPDADLALAVKGSVAVMRTLDGVIVLLEKAVKGRIRLRPPFKPLLTVSGIGQIIGLTIMLETGAISRFAKVGNYASYCRCVGSERISNGKRKGRGNTKNGNKYLAWAFMEAAHYSAIWSPEIKRFYEKRKAKRHILVAKKTVANKLARAIYHMLKRQEPFDVNRAFG